MFLRIMAVLLGVIGLAGVGLALVALQRPVAVEQAAAPPPPPVVKTSILVAARPQRAGNLMVADDVTALEVPAGKEPRGSFADSVANRTTLRGAMVRRSLTAGEVILAADVLNPGDRGFLAAVLGAGMRAVTIGVDSVSGTAGLIWPGDHVDLVLTQSIDDHDQPADRRISGETVLTDLRVIAVDQQLVQGGQGGQPNANAAGGNRTVTIEASLYDAQRIAVASRLGRIALVVRAAADDQPLAGNAAPADATAAATPGTPAAPATPAQTNQAQATPAQPAIAQAVATPAAAPAAAADGVAAAPPATAGQPPIAWAGDVSPALRDRSGGKSGASIHLYHGPGSVDEVKF